MLTVLKPGDQGGYVVLIVSVSRALFKQMFFHHRDTDKQKHDGDADWADDCPPEYWIRT